MPGSIKISPDGFDRVGYEETLHLDGTNQLTISRTASSPGSAPYLHSPYYLQHSARECFLVGSCKGLRISSVGEGQGESEDSPGELPFHLRESYGLIVACLFASGPLERVVTEHNGECPRGSEVESGVRADQAGDGRDGRDQRHGQGQ